jgi:tetratricopeptide (TPR) repeat protein
MNEEKIAEVYWRLGLLYWSEGEIEQAKKEFRRAAELNPRFGVEYDKFRGERGERVELESYLLLPIE